MTTSERIRYDRPSRADAGRPTAEQRWTLFLACLAMFMLLLDISVVTVALPNIQQSLNSQFSDLQWVIDAYVLALAAVLLPAGSLADRFGRRRLFVIGMAIFTAASLTCALAWSPLALNVARAVQGVGGAILFSTALALIAQAFPGAARARALGIGGAVIGVALAVGPLVGGALTHLGWEWIFLVNVPVGGFALAVSLRKLPESRDPRAKGLDLPGVATFSAALFALVFALIRGNDEGWSSTPIIALFAAAAILLVLFLIVEAVQERPMFDLSLFRKPVFLGASVSAFALHASLVSVFLFLTLYLENALGYSPLETGLRLLPLTLMTLVAAPAAARIQARVGLHRLIGASLVAIGGGLMLQSGVSSGDPWTVLLPGFLLAGLGFGAASPLILQAALSVVEPARAGMASGISVTFRQVGTATGIAALGAIFQHRVETKVTDVLAGSPAGAAEATRLAAAVARGSARQAVEAAPQPARGVLSAAATEATVAALNEVLVIAAVVAIIGGLVAFVLLRAGATAARLAPAVESLRSPAPAAPKRAVPAAAAKRPTATALPAVPAAPALEPRGTGRLEPRGTARLAIAAAWSFMFALAVVLTIGSIVLVVLGASGVNVA
jgi:EmrB/QacA subfamily drug resistance transporter